MKAQAAPCPGLVTTGARLQQLPARGCTLLERPACKHLGNDAVSPPQPQRAGPGQGLRTQRSWPRDKLRLDTS